MNLNDFYRLTSALRNKIFMMLARGIVKAVKNDEGTQKLQIVCLADETLGNVERLQEYGFETFPDTDAEVFAAFVNGNRETGVVLVTHDRRYRPTTLTSGEVMLYTKFGQSIHLKADGSVVVASDKIELGNGTVRKLVDERLLDAFNNHVHATAATGPPSTPTTPLVLADIATTVTKAE